MRPTSTSSSGFGPDFEPLAFRRGWTHGVLALALWPFVLTGVLLAWDRFVRLRRKPDAAPARAGPLLALTALAVISHPTLDWLNNYGLRWLMPFDGRWFYGDALFVIDRGSGSRRRRRVPHVLEEPARARAMGRVLRAGNHADRGEHDAGSLERSRARAGAVSSRVGRRRCGVGRGAVAVPRRATGGARTCGAGRSGHRGRLRLRDRWLLARRHATRCAP